MTTCTPFFRSLLCICSLSFLVLHSPLLIAAARGNQQSADIAGSLHGKVVLQGRPLGKMAATLKVQLYEAGHTTAAFTYHISCNTLGEFAIDNIPPGAYVITVKNSNTLQVAAAAVIATDDITTATFEMLPGGDANNDNQITQLDFSILSHAFGSIEGGRQYNIAADFNVDAIVSVLDFSLLAENYNRQGYQVTEVSYSQLSAENSTAALYVKE